MEEEEIKSQGEGATTEEATPAVEEATLSTQETEVAPEEVTTTVQAAEASPEEDGKTKRNRRKERVGKVVSNKMNKSITVLVERRLKHPMYGKFLTKTKKFIAHDEKEECNEGDTVRIMECRPLSKNKRWRLIKIIERAK